MKGLRVGGERNYTQANSYKTNKVPGIYLGEMSHSGCSSFYTTHYLNSAMYYSTMHSQARIGLGIKKLHFECPQKNFKKTNRFGYGG